MTHVIELAERVTLTNWMKTYKRITPSWDVAIPEYDAVVDRLIDEIKGSEISAADVEALKKIWTDEYLLRPQLLSKEEFYALVDELGVGNFVNLKKFTLFLKKSAQINHVFNLHSDFHILVRYYGQLRNNPNDAMNKFAIEKALNRLGRASVVDALILEVRVKNFTRIDNIIGAYTELQTITGNFEKELIGNIPSIFTSVKY